MRDLITSGIKTAVQLGVASFVAWLLQFGIDIGSQAQALENVLFLIFAGVITVILNWAGKKFPVINKIISLGLSGNTVSYSQ